jgi:hypothetical protein
MSTSANTGKETSVYGSTKQAANIEDSKPEEPKQLLFHPDLLIGSDLPSDVRLSDITTDLESEKDLLLLRSGLLDLECSLPNPLESLLITEERIEVKKVLIPTKSVLQTISAN